MVCFAGACFASRLVGAPKCCWTSDSRYLRWFVTTFCGHYRSRCQHWCLESSVLGNFRLWYSTVCDHHKQILGQAIRRAILGFLIVEGDYLNSSVLNTAIWKDGSTENSPFNHRFNKLNPGTSQVGIGQVYTQHSNTGRVGTSKIGTSQISKIKIGMAEISSSQVSTLQISTPQTGLAQSSSPKISSAQVDLFQKDLANERITQIDPTQIGSIQFISPPNLNAGKIPLSSSIASEQFFSIHSLSSATINDLYSNSFNLWNSLPNVLLSQMVISNSKTSLQDKLLKRKSLDSHHHH
jgi:hypothetical protein